jgi:serpin B
MIRRSLLAASLAVSLCAGAGTTNARVAIRRSPPVDALAVDATSGFTFDLYAQLANDKANANKNLVFSPLSLELALGMTYNGAIGKTATEMASALHLDQFESQADAARGLRALEATLNSASGKSKDLELRIVDRIWAQKGIAWSKLFLGSADVEQTSFTKAEQVRKTINAWVEKQTNARIKDLIPEGVLDSQTVMVLGNAIYFKGQWVHKFDKKETKTDSFTTAAGKKVKAPLMHQQTTLLYTKQKDAQIVELPYKDSTLAMDVIVPTDAKGLADVEKELTSGNVPSWFAQLTPTDDVDLTMPRFQVTLPLSLAEILEKLGMKSAFDAGSADFSGMLDAGEKSGHKPYISAVVHKAFVLVDEEGSEAAAATAVVIREESLRIPPKVRADHPFVWIIRDTKTGAILFIGRVTDPTVKG